MPVCLASRHLTFFYRLAQLRAEHAPALLDAIAAQPFSNVEGETRPPLMPEHWRGRMGMSMDEQRRFIEQYIEIS